MEIKKKEGAILLALDDRRLRKPLHWLLLARVIVLTIILGIGTLIQVKGKIFIMPPLPFLLVFTAIIYLFTIFSALYLRKIKSLLVFAYFQIMADIAMISALIFLTGSSNSVFTVLLFFPVITGGTLLFRTGSLLMACLCTLSFVLILLIEKAGYFPKYFNDFKFSPITDYNMVLQHLAIPGLAFFLMAILTSILSEKLHRAEAALSQTSLDYDRLAILNKQILNDINTGIITVDEENMINSFNRAAEDITGFSLQDVLDHPLSKILPEIDGEQKAAIRLTGELTRKDGRMIPIGYAWTRLNMPAGCGNCRVFTMQDLSHIKRMEAQIQQAQKMATIGEMAAGVAHEFRNPLAAISGAAQILENENTGAQARQKLREIIVRECDRLDSTIEEFLLFSKRSSPSKTWFELAKLVEECVQMLRQKPDWDKGCRISNEIPDHLEIHGDRDQIKQVLINLITNGCTAMEKDGGKLRILAQEKKDGQERLSSITVANTGPPIPADLLESIFEPFFTTRENGTGLGLAIVKQIIQRHGGKIAAANMPEEAGVLFSIQLPMA